MGKDIITTQTDNLPDTSKYKPKYTPISQVNELLQKGLSNPQIGKILGIHPSAVCRLIQRHGLNPLEDECYKKNRADILASKQRLLINNITVSSVKKMAVRDNVVSFGILYDKERLERNLSTENLAIRSVSQDLNDLLDQLQHSQVVDNQDNQPQSNPDNDNPLPPNMPDYVKSYISSDNK